MLPKINQSHIGGGISASLTPARDLRQKEHHQLRTYRNNTNQDSFTGVKANHIQTMASPYVNEPQKLFGKEGESSRSFTNIVSYNQQNGVGQRTTRTAGQHQQLTLQPSSTLFDPRPQIHKPQNSLAHPARPQQKYQNDEDPTSNPKSFADLRLKLGDKRGTHKNDDLESLPSEFSEDEWAEIVKFRKEQFEEDKKKEAERFLAKKLKLREVLDTQLREQKSVKDRQIQEKKAYEFQLLQRMKEKEEQEQLKKREHQDKVIKQKMLRDLQLEEAKRKKEAEAKD